MGAMSGDCGCGCDGLAAFPANPATALNYHFGMLLGVDDLKAEQAFHTGRLQRHQRELHAQGVARGMKVTFNAETGVLKVSPGFAVDQLGRDIEIINPQCLDLAAYLAANRQRLPAPDGTDKGSDLDLVVSASACFERPVQAIAAECNGSNADITYSRLSERPTLELVAARPAHEAALPAPISDLYKAIADGKFVPDPNSPEQVTLAALAGEIAQPDADTAKYAAFIQQIALVASLEAGPPAPAVMMEEPYLVLARLKGVAPPVKEGEPAKISSLHCDIRRLLLPQGFRHNRDMLAPTALPTGPLVAQVQHVGLDVTVTFDRAVAPGSLVAGAFQVLELSASAINPLAFTVSHVGPANAPTGAKLTLGAAPQGILRLTVHGTGANPIVDSAFRALGQKPGDDGHNFVTTL